MTMIGPEMALVQGRIVPRTGTEQFARLEHWREDPVRVQGHTLAAALTRQYVDRLGRESIPWDLRRRRPEAAGRRVGFWTALKGYLAGRGPRAPARRRGAWQ